MRPQTACPRAHHHPHYQIHIKQLEPNCTLAKAITKCEGGGNPGPNPNPNPPTSPPPPEPPLPPITPITPKAGALRPHILLWVRQLRLYFGPINFDP